MGGDDETCQPFDMTHSNHLSICLSFEPLLTQKGQDHAQSRLEAEKRERNTLHIIYENVVGTSGCVHM